MGLNDEVGIELLVDFIENEGSAYIAKIVAAGYGVRTMDNFPKVLVKCNEYNQFVVGVVQGDGAVTQRVSPPRPLAHTSR